MADKKITDLTELTALDTNDLFVVVDDPAGTPITKKITVGNILANTTLYTNSSVTFRSAFKAALVHNAAMTTANVVAAAEFTTTATAVSTNTSHQYGIVVTNLLNAAAANVITELASAKFTLDVSNAAALQANTFGLIISVANTGTRAAQPTAFLKITDSTTGVNTTSTKYLFSANVQSNTSTGSGNITMLFTNSTAAAATHKLRVQINGTDYFLLLSNTGQAGV